MAFQAMSLGQSDRYCWKLRFKKDEGSAHEYHGLEARGTSNPSSSVFGSVWVPEERNTDRE